MTTKRKRKCPFCKGTGEQLAPPTYPPKRMADVPRYKCQECDGTGVEQHFQMMFWKYDQFPYVLASRGFLRKDGLCYCPSYNACFKPVKIMTMEQGQEVAKLLEGLTAAYSLAMDALKEQFNKQLHDIAPWLK
jgi:hypothetical protein